ncbi:Zinc finger transcription factor family protein 30 [Caenorhabditis elegans]|uniref:Zinc finger transcription factor family protein 30 n=1 Tax=Caenorhabditis elegans TaxID=6239 RepID=ZTF30_CAEEL|nr:Zinc finger transcription factor family protein 30 [Caenorhabditis elegans]P34303.1 RecName: Full=Zinc finger transcription factor family protein 30 [Caenorhabditis elegans]CCD62568.1 Zinc finger transcription factor family protein 30 [Caenorhabditis elegans]|eukprot:NP_498892.1 Zinc finger transcription factor family protein 30 [Caenorhabditis elegans]
MKLEDDKIHSPTNTEEEGYGSDVEVENGTDISGSKGGSGVELKRPDLKGSFRCSICSKVFCHSSSLSRHRMQAHFKSYKCTVCRKDISSSESLRTHMFKQHHISRMYMCRCCNWAFPDKSLLHIHLQTATNNNDSNNNNNSVIPHGVINRSCHLITDPFQLIRTPLLNLPTPQSLESSVPSLPIASIPIPALQSPIRSQPQTPSWLANLPKPIPTTAPIFVADSKEKIKDEVEKPDVYTSQSPTCSSVSFKSDLSAFHQLCSDRALISSPLIDTASPSSSSSSSRISPRHECFDCHVSRTKILISENKCKLLEHKIGTMQQESLEANAQMNGLEQTVLRLRMEAHALREHNELFQRKLLECQNLAVKFLQNDKAHDASEMNSFLRILINNTILTRPF